MLFYEGNLATIHIDEALYEIDTSDHFFARFTIRNTVNEAIGVDLSNYWTVIFPNQWGIYQRNYRPVINERHIIPKEVNDIKSVIIQNYKNNKLLKIPLQGEVVYYREFNASGREDIKIKKGEYFILSFDGQLFITDGNMVEGVYCDGRVEIKDLVLSFPITWKKISADGIVILDKNEKIK